MATSSDGNTTTVTIPLDRLRELEACEAAVKAAKERDRVRLEALRAKIDPAENAKRALDRYYANRDEILARRKEARKAKKAATAGTPTPTA
jgi:hypothetical protein